MFILQYFLGAGGGDVQVDLRGGDGTVPQKLLDILDVNALFQ